MPAVVAGTERGLLEADAVWLRLTQAGRLFANEALEAFAPDP